MLQSLRGIKEVINLNFTLSISAFLFHLNDSLQLIGIYHM
jgi:hypothetical protein